jgi:hypothetical protein
MGLVEHRSATSEEFQKILKESLVERKRLSVRLTDHEIRKRSHFVVSLTLYQ